MKCNKAARFDGILSKACKVLCAKNEGIGILIHLFNQIKKIFPSELKPAIIFLIHKGIGCTDEPGNCRGISLLSVWERYSWGSCVAG
jgi:hypothetical protein